MKGRSSKIFLLSITGLLLLVLGTVVLADTGLASSSLASALGALAIIARLWQSQRSLLNLGSQKP